MSHNSPNNHNPNIQSQFQPYVQLSVPPSNNGNTTQAPYQSYYDPSMGQSEGVSQSSFNQGYQSTSSFAPSASLASDDGYPYQSGHMYAPEQKQYTIVSELYLQNQMHNLDMLVGVISLVLLLVSSINLLYIIVTMSVRAFWSHDRGIKVASNIFGSFVAVLLFLVAVLGLVSLKAKSMRRKRSAAFMQLGLFAVLILVNLIQICLQSSLYFPLRFLTSASSTEKPYCRTISWVSWAPPKAWSRS